MIYRDILFLVGRIIYGGYFLNAGISHFRHLNGMAGYTASKDVPMPKLAVLLSGLLIVLGGFGILAGVFIKYAVVCLVVFLVPVTLIMHAYWKETDPNALMTQKIMFWKNMAMLAAALMMLAIPEPWMYSLF